MTGTAPQRATGDSVGRRPVSGVRAVAWLLAVATALGLAWLGIGRARVSAMPEPTAGWATDAQIDAFVQRRAAELRLAGLAVVVVRDAEVYYSGSYGTAGGTPVRGDTPFILGSTSKQFTGLAVQRLIADGRLTLDTQIGDVLPDFALAPDARGAITVRDLLGHTSGFSTEAGLQQWGWRPGRPDSIVTNAAELARAPRTTAPGASYEYSNANYDLLGAVIERVTGEPFAEALERLVTVPLGLKGTTGHPDATQATGTAVGHYPWWNVATIPTPSPHTPGAVPSSFQVSTADDLTRLLQAHLAPAGSTQGEVLASARRPLSTINEYAQYASGWVVRPLWEQHALNADPLNPALPSCVVHDGGTYRSQSYLLACPTLGFGLVSLSNTGAGADTNRWELFQADLVHVILGTPAPEATSDPLESHAPLLMLGSITVQTGTAILLVTSLRRRRHQLGASAAAVLVAVATLVGWWLYVPVISGRPVPIAALWASVPEVGLTTILTSILAAITGLALVVGASTKWPVRR
jgi:CubicO group peptidase (beta-lactamase class C family)